MWEVLDKEVREQANQDREKQKKKTSDEEDIVASRTWSLA